MIGIQRVTAVLDAFALARRRLTVREIAALTGVPRSSVHRIIRELEVSQYVVAVPSGGYRLGPGMLKIALCQQDWIIAPMRPTLAALSQSVNENVDLAILSGNDVVIIEQIAQAQRLRAVTTVGRTFSLHASCVGKVLLAQLPQESVIHLLPDTLPMHAQNTITDRARLLEEIAEVRRTGIAFDHEEHDVGISAVATSLHHPSGVPQAVAIVAPTHRFAHRSSVYVAALRHAHTRSLAIA
ncbi:Putative transcriptional regulator, IclR family [Mycobacteroides abscessus subsp. bolletii]|uniref:IclR family transcriptional regulator n=1 Tax=Mycobacteroides abscessus TaxID=36809 RepID=UPI0009A59EBE|nr:IclR family transcriptional regulator [Mycobacteroides abscessus]SKG70451.1 Putative transcriptional regulator, IclR family [Mycobacteroides abscessus subsp. bolletii]SLF40779.1 Putative transcriptional regulator, IclR family [Mycobacteroides abscessus subsp. bolletii]